MDLLLDRETIDRRYQVEIIDGELVGKTSSGPQIAAGREVEIEKCYCGKLSVSAFASVLLISGGGAVIEKFSSNSNSNMCSKVVEKIQGLAKKPAKTGTSVVF